MGLRKHRIMHVASGDLWAGAEVAVARLLPELKLHHDVGVIVFNEGILSQKLREKRIKVYLVQEKGSFRDIPMLIRIKQILRSEMVELLHTHGYKEDVIGVIAGRLAGVKRFVCTRHGAPEPFKEFARIRMGVYLLLDYFVNRYGIQKIISVSEDLRDRLSEEYGSEKVVTIHNGIQLSHSSLVDKTGKRRELGLSPRKRIVGTVGRLKPVKGIHYLLKAAKIMSESRRDLAFLIVGDGPLEDELKDMARSLGISDDTFFLGFRKDALQIMSVMDVFVLSSLHEGIPLSLLEAMGMGIPVVATRVGGIPEVIEHGRSGILVPPQDEKALARAILDMLSPRAKEVGREAKRRVSEEFSLERMVERTEEVYRELLRDEERASET